MRVCIYSLLCTTLSLHRIGCQVRAPTYCTEPAPNVASNPWRASHLVTSEGILGRYSEGVVLMGVRHSKTQWCSVSKAAAVISDGQGQIKPAGARHRWQGRHTWAGAQLASASHRRRALHLAGLAAVLHRQRRRQRARHRLLRWRHPHRHARLLPLAHRGWQRRGNGLRRRWARGDVDLQPVVPAARQGGEAGG